VGQANLLHQWNSTKTPVSAELIFIKSPLARLP
jgi:hypothetical protein